MRGIKQILVLLCFCAVSLTAQKDDLITLSSGAYKSRGWYKDMLTQLKTHNKIDTLDAHLIKLTSSDGRVAKENCSALVNKYGGLLESNIHAIAYNRKNDTLYYVITQSGEYSHLFVYNRVSKKLSAVQNTRVAVIANGRRMVLNAVAPKLVIFAVKKQDDPEDYHQFYLYHEQKGSFTHFKNCKRVQGKVQCENVKL
jgi:hypothetical protein